MVKKVNSLKLQCSLTTSVRRTSSGLKVMPCRGLRNYNICPRIRRQRPPRGPARVEVELDATSPAYNNVTQDLRRHEDARSRPPA